MLHKVRNRIKDEQGFTLIELLVVILIIGILAAIALPSFLGQRSKAQDSEAKSNARNLVSHVETCYAEKQTYVGCDTAAEIVAANGDKPTGLNLVDSPTNGGEVGVVAPATATTFTIKAVSKSGAIYYMKRNADGTTTGPSTTS